MPELPKVDSNYAALLILILAPFSFALCFWFIRRFINHYDAFKSSTSAEIQSVAAAVSSATGMVEKAVRKTQEEAVQVQRSFIEFQGRVNTELLEISRKTVQIEGHMDQTRMRAKEMEEGIQKFSNEFRGFADEITARLKEGSNQIEANKKTVTLAARVVDKHESELRVIRQDLLILAEKKRS